MNRDARRSRGWVLALVSLCMVGAGRAPAPASAAGERGPNQRRLVLKLGGGPAHLGLERSRGQPYPEFLLQRWEAGAWKVHPAEDFARGAGQVVIPITQPGTYRVVAAASPYELYESPPVEMAEGDKQEMTSLRASSPGTPCELRVLSARTGRPLAGRSIALSGPYSSLPPSRAVTGADGRLKLGKVRTQELHLELEHGGDEPLAWERAQQCLDSGRVELRVP